MHMHAPNNLLRIPEVARQLAVSVRTTHTLIAHGDLPVVRIGRAVRIRQSALQALIEARETRVKPRRVLVTRKNTTNP